MTVTPDVDVIIAVHTPARPIERAVRSVLDGACARVRVTVIVHNTDIDPISRRLAAWDADDRVRIVPFHDGIPSPAGPMNKGFDLATAPYVALLGSDDTFERGAVDAWLQVARRDHADMVIAPIRTTSGLTAPSPPVRVGRRRNLRAAADRLVYRSAPLGLLSVRFMGGLRFTLGITTGEDQPFLAQIWSSAGRLSFPVTGPGYLVHDDQGDRVTKAPRPVPEEFAYLDAMLDPSAAWMRDQSLRLALLAKILRVHVFNAYENRTGAWNADSAASLAAVIERIVASDARVLRVLSRTEAHFISALRDPSTPNGILATVASQRRARIVGSVLTSDVRYALHRQAPLRLRISGILVAVTRRRTGGDVA